MPEFNARLKALRNEKKLKQTDIADFLGITSRNYQDYEYGKIDPPTSKTIALADFFDVSLDFLTGRSDNPNSHKL